MNIRTFKTQEDKKEYGKNVYWKVILSMTSWWLFCMFVFGDGDWVFIPAMLGILGIIYYFYLAPSKYKI
jgi:uncharacterized membrane protein